MIIAAATGALSEPITGLPTVNASGQGGLLDVITDPQFGSNRMVYWTFSESTSVGNLTAVAKGTLSADERKMENVQVIYRATPAYTGTLHYGSRIVIDKTGNLIFSTGERSDIETRPQAQYLNSSLGKIIRITKDGQPAAGNPFAGQAGARTELYSYGHRNVQGLAFHPVTGELWENEFGPKGGDELNIIKPGNNYGWPNITYGMEYSGEKVGAGITQQAGNSYNYVVRYKQLIKIELLNRRNEITADATMQLNFDLRKDYYYQTLANKITAHMVKQK